MSPRPEPGLLPPTPVLFLLLRSWPSWYLMQSLHDTTSQKSPAANVCPVSLSLLHNCFREHQFISLYPGALLISPLQILPSPPPAPCLPLACPLRSFLKCLHLKSVKSSRVAFLNSCSTQRLLNICVYVCIHTCVKIHRYRYSWPTQ